MEYVCLGVWALESRCCSNLNNELEYQVPESSGPPLTIYQQYDESLCLLLDDRWSWELAI